MAKAQTGLKRFGRGWDAGDKTFEQAQTILANTWTQGRRVLVVLGAGASVAAGIPRMNGVFGKLRKRLDGLVSEWADKIRDAPNKAEETHNLQRERERLLELRQWLASLADNTAPRSTSAKALGMMQRASEQASHSMLFKRLHETWLAFSKDFISDIAKCQKPTSFHDLIAGWAVAGRADLISVNFDGLTRKALQGTLDKNKSLPGVAIALCEPSEVSRFFLGEAPTQTPNHPLVPVFKVWGDVFHAVCVDKRCPQSGVRAPIFNLVNGQGHTGQLEYRCPDCHGERQLQIFFAGYEEKERAATGSVGQLLKYVAPRVGCVMTVGFSGIWDQSLVKFLALICSDLDKEKSWLHRLTDPSESSEDVSVIRQRSWINVDVDQHPPLLEQLASFGISALNLTMTAEDFAKQAPMPPETAIKPLDKFTGDGVLPDGLWDQIIKEEKPCPAVYADILSESQVSQNGYLQDLTLLRQLGVKTRISLGANRASDIDSLEPNHNRQLHSFGASHLAILWFRHLVRQPNVGLSASETERLAAVTMLTAIHHDIGHLPFTHLAEDIFSELHWTLEDWSDIFRHDEPVLANCSGTIRQQVFKLTRDIANKLNIPPLQLRMWVESAIQARSGYHWLDAILNSPLDTDKLDYVFRDCGYLGQGIHIAPGENRREWIFSLFNGTRILPSGLVALAGTSGEHARDFLEERIWLYKHQYHQPGYRAFERIGAAVVLQWLIHMVPSNIVSSQEYRDFTSDVTAVLGDSASLKGHAAKRILWDKLKGSPNHTKHGEPALLLTIVTELIENKHLQNGLLSPSPRLSDWAKRCRDIIKSAFDDWHPQEDGGEYSLLQHLKSKAGMTSSDVVHVPVKNMKRIKEIIRHIETLHPFRAIFDVAVTPRILSYPTRRRLELFGEATCGECFAVSHKDPDRWGVSTNRWIPLSETAFAERDNNRWAKVIVVSPEPYDPSVTHSLDKFRDVCRAENIPVTEADPTDLYVA